MKKVLRTATINGTTYGFSEATYINWNELTNPNLNDYTQAGVYEIYGERTNTQDNLPISNSATGHSFNARLTVLDSSLQKADESTPTEICVTQILMLSNRKGHEGKMYIRTYNQNNAVADGWSNWREFSNVLTLGNDGITDMATLDATTTWGEYNGVLFDFNWLKLVNGSQVDTMNNLKASINMALTALSGGEVYAYLNELYFTHSSDEKGALTSNLFGAMFKMKVYDNDPVRNGMGAIIGDANLTNAMKQYLKRRIVQELDIVPFTFLPMDAAQAIGQQPRVIRRYGDVNTDGTITWSKFYELDGSESIYQYAPSQFWKS